MNIFDKIMADVSSYVYGALVALISAVIWLLRKVITNEQQLKLLNQEIAMREEWRKENDEEIKAQLKELREDVKALVNRAIS